MLEYDIKDYVEAEAVHGFYCYKCKRVRTVRLKGADDIQFCPACKGVMVRVESDSSTEIQVIVTGFL